MSTFVELVRAELVAATAVTDLVAQRIYPLVAPQGTVPPYVVVFTASDVPVNSVDGKAADRLHVARVQVDVYGGTYLSAHAAASVVSAVVEDLARSDLSAYLDAKRDLYDDEAQLHRVSMDFFVSA